MLKSCNDLSLGDELGCVGMSHDSLVVLLSFQLSYHWCVVIIISSLNPSSYGLLILVF
jgi:hypothetical protein